MSAPELPDFTGYDWDRGNLEKNWLKHRVTALEAEQVFQNRPIILIDDATHSQKEARTVALGKTDLERLLTVIFTVRGRMIRIISARDMNHDEKAHYERGL